MKKVLIFTSIFSSAFWLMGCPAPAEETSEICNDNTDNDGDGATDCDDSDCSTASNCEGVNTPAECGNNIVETGETCDGNALATLGSTCENEGFYPGILNCQSDCMGYDTSSCGGRCGDGEINNDELCDGSDVGTLSCSNFAYATGSLGCNANCDGYDLSGCSGGDEGNRCGNGVVEGLERCDEGAAGSVTSDCSALSAGLGEGSVTCTDKCLLDTSACEESDLCAALEWYEDGFCDPCELMGGVADAVDCAACSVSDGNCVDYFSGLSGTYACGGDGSTDPDCGADNICTDGEASVSCADLTEGDTGFSGGTIDCSNNNIPDTSTCFILGSCGDNIINGFEQCDGAIPAGVDCTFSEDFVGGPLGCNPDCTLDVSACREDPVCGDGFVEGDEPCDAGGLNGADPSTGDLTCGNIGFRAGDGLGCTANCTALDTSACVVPACGDGVVDNGEVCDPGGIEGATLALAGETCSDQGYQDTAALDCNANCLAFNTDSCTPLESCGNGTVDSGEVCDPGDGGSVTADLDGKTCETQGLTGSGLGCATDCLSFETAACDPQENCGNDALDDGEDCDGAVLPLNDCGYFGLGAGSVACDVLTCTYVLDSCDAANCGNGVLEGSERCDGSDFNGFACADLSDFGTGALACNTNCTLDVGNCQPSTCGNGAVEQGEQCDPGDGASNPAVIPGNTTCADLNFGAGTVVCTEECVVDASSCEAASTCDGTALDGVEVCDGDNLGGETCENLGFASGTLACDSSCARYDTSACVPAGQDATYCGDGIAAGYEDCDGLSFSFLADSCDNGGVATCSSECELDLSACIDSETEGPNADACYGADGEGGITNFYGDGVCDTNCLNVDPDCSLCGAQVEGNDDGVCPAFLVDTRSGADSCTDFGVIDNDCAELCGNGVLDAPEGFTSETCDGDAFGSFFGGLVPYSCEAFGYNSGTLACTTGCGLDFSGCTL